MISLDLGYVGWIEMSLEGLIMAGDDANCITFGQCTIFFRWVCCHSPRLQR